LLFLFHRGRPAIGRKRDYRQSPPEINGGALTNPAAAMALIERVA
jgi:hypothetical protein